MATKSNRANFSLSSSFLVILWSQPGPNRRPTETSALRTLRSRDTSAPRHFSTYIWCQSVPDTSAPVSKCLKTLRHRLLTVDRAAAAAAAFHLMLHSVGGLLHLQHWKNQKKYNSATWLYSVDFYTWYWTYPVDSSVLWFCIVMMAFGTWRPY